MLEINSQKFLYIILYFQFYDHIQGITTVVFMYNCGTDFCGPSASHNSNLSKWLSFPDCCMGCLRSSCLALLLPLSISKLIVTMGGPQDKGPLPVSKLTFIMGGPQDEGKLPLMLGQKPNGVYPIPCQTTFALL